MYSQSYLAPQDTHRAPVAATLRADVHRYSAAMVSWHRSAALRQIKGLHARSGKLTA